MVTQGSNSSKRIRPLFKVLSTLIITIGVFLGSQIISLIGLLVFYNFNTSKMIASFGVGSVLGLSALAEILFGITAIFLINKNNLVLNLKRPSGKTLAEIVLAVIVIQIGSSLLTSWINSIFHFGIPRDNVVITSFIKSHPNQLILIILFVVVIAPICEELLFRGFLFNSLIRQSGGVLTFWPAAIISGVIFGLAHLEPVEFIPLTLTGMYLSWLFYTRNRNILTNIIAHGCINLTAVVAIVFTIK